MTTIPPNGSDSDADSAEHEKEINQRVYVFLISAILENGKKTCFDYVSSLKNEACNRALKRIAGHIDMDLLNKLVEETTAITEMQKDFYKVMLSERKEKIPDYSMELLLKQELSQQEQESSPGLSQELKCTYLKSRELNRSFYESHR